MEAHAGLTSADTNERVGAGGPVLDVLDLDTFRNLEDALAQVADTPEFHAHVIVATLLGRVDLADDQAGAVIARGCVATS